MEQLPARCSILLQPANSRQGADATLLTRLVKLREADVEMWANDCVLKHTIALGFTTRKVNARLIEALTWVTASEVTQVIASH